ncbi:MAG: response regulator [Cyclobacteriaceae bacterium]
MLKAILIVDDSESTREILSYVLKFEGFEVFSSVDGLDALRVLSGRSIDLVITDLNMPNMDGFALIKKIRTMPQYYNTPIILLTIESSEEKKNKAKEVGANGWIIKPFQKEELLNAVNKFIG